MNAITEIPDASDLPATIKRARNLFSAGDVKLAKVLAVMAEGQAKAQADVAKRLGAARELVDKARRLQGDALLIETRCNMRLADEYDAAQAAGEAAKKGRPKNADGGGIFTLADAGMTSQDIADARKLRDAEAKEPGLVARAIAARVAAGFEPTRRNLRHAIGNRSATKDERGDNLYETPIEAMRTLLALERFNAQVWEPAVGRGAILRPLEDAGYDVRISDLRDRGVATMHGECQQVIDFLETKDDGIARDIVTNPPYGGVLNAFVAHALRAHRPPKMAVLLNWNAYLGFEDADRNFWLDENPPARIWAFSRRLPMMHRDGWDGPRSTSQMNTAWFVWDGETAKGDTRTARVDWQDYQDAPPLKPEGA